MKISVDGVDLFELNDTQIKVICDNVHGDMFDADMKRRLKWVLMHKYEQCFKELKKQWDPILEANGVESVPTNPDRYAELIFAQPNYKCRKSRELEAAQARGE